MQFRFLFFFLFLFFVEPLMATHIIGGEVTYECLGNGEYLIEFHIYRDCAEGNEAFDSLGILTYFICDADGNCADKMQEDGQTLRVLPSLIRDVEAPELECLAVPPGICVQEAIYTFEIDGRRALFNPMVDSSYVIIFQRCCRNETIENITDPGDTGSSYIVEINPPSQSRCNSSPKFNSFPPTVICNQVPINFDHSASDIDGDSLVYSFCSPLTGGGVIGDGQTDGSFTVCDGVAPEPACPDNIQNVPFITSAYTPEAPMAGNPVVSIDPATGLITGTPQVLGQFVVGVCVDEYRDGVYLGSIQRDFQFNVADCISGVTAQISGENLVETMDANGDPIFTVTTCGQNGVTLINESFDRGDIDSIRWEFEEGTIINDDWDVILNFPDQGLYNGKLFLNPLNPVCTDSANIFINVLPDIEANFSQSFDSCSADPVVFTDASTADDPNGIISWQWNFDDGNTASQTSPTHQYATAGTYNISLTVTDDNGCQDSEMTTIIYAPPPTAIEIAQSSTGGCEPTPIIFTNNSSPIDDEFSFLWDFGDGNTSDAINPTHIYETAGTYSISLSIETPNGCEISRAYPDLVTILPSPTAGFSLFPDELSATDPTVQITDGSQNADTWLYNFNNQGNSTLPNPTFTFRDTGTQTILQIVTAVSGCTDTAIQTIDIIPFVQWFMPNAFTPTRDGVNDIFIGNGSLAGATNFNFTIWNRWGELVFETDDYNEGWNGRKNNTGRDSPAGVYVYVLTYRTPRGDRVQLDGFATLIR